jgi:hypothetical protein
VWLVAIILNVPALLNSRREDILPPHLVGASSHTAGE